jgi:hypothetical protein
MGCGLSSETAGQRNTTITVSSRGSLAGGQNQYDHQIVPHEGKRRSSPTDLNNHGVGVGPSSSPSSPRRSGQPSQDLTRNDLSNSSKGDGYPGPGESQPVSVPGRLEIFSSADQSTETMDIIVSQPSTQKHKHGKVDGDLDRPATQRHGTVVLASDDAVVDPNHQRICLQASNSQLNLVGNPLPGSCHITSASHAFPSRYSDTASSTSYERGAGDHHDSLSLGGYSTTSYSSSRNSSTTESRARTTSSEGTEFDTYCLNHTTTATAVDNPLARHSTPTVGTAPQVAVVYAHAGPHSSDSVVSSASGSPTRVSKPKRAPFFLVSRDDPKERAHEEYHHLVVKHTEWVLSQQPGARIGGNRLNPDLGPGEEEEQEELPPSMGSDGVAVEHEQTESIA